MDGPRGKTRGEKRGGKPGRDADRLAGLQGHWRSHGYGSLLEIGSSGYRLFEETRVSCLGVFGGTLEELATHYVDVRRSPGGMAFSARRATGVTRVKFRRMGSLPCRCTSQDPDLLKDPIHNFEVFWHTFAERYALFELRRVDWQATHDAYRPGVSSDTPARRLYEIFVEMLRPLRDGHVELRTPFGRFNAGGPSAVHLRLAAERGVGDPDAAIGALLVERLERARGIVHERYLGSRVRRSANGLVEWGRLDEATGYLAIRAMAGQSGRVDRPREDQQQAAAAMNHVLRDVGHLPSLVVDLRDNLGGYDGVALRIAGFLTDRKRLAFTKAASKGEGYGGRQSITLEPRGSRRYTGRIFLLTSGLTTSAAEIFVLSLLKHPRLVRIGEPTHGELSDVMERHLPNGWSLTLSNELYRASDGELYEDRGVPPHVRVPYLDRRDLDAGRDPMLDRALAEGPAFSPRARPPRSG